MPPNKQIEDRYSHLNLPVTPVNVKELFPWNLTPSDQHPGSDEALVNPQYLRLVGSVVAKKVFEAPAEAPVELSPRGTSLLRDAMGVLERVKEDLKKTGTVAETPIISDKPFPEFLEMVAADITDQREFRYIMSAIDKMIESIERIRSEIWTHQSEGTPVPDNIGEPKHRASKTPRITY